MDLKQLGKYEINSKRGEGGFGAVYRATDTKLKRTVAVKVLHPQVATDEMLAAYFEREALALARLEHVNIVRVYDYDQIDGINFIVMEYIEGTDLDQLMKEGQSFPLEQIISIFRQLLAALGYAHDHGVVHRDIKPSNIMLTKSGEVKITDFGIAKVAGSAKLTRTGTGAGSLLYMSPEQIKGKDIDNRSDLYSVGVTLYQIAAGRTPFEADSDYDIMTGHLERTPPSPTQFSPDIPKDLEQIILKALEKKPEKRFQSAVEMTEALDRISASGVKTVYRPAETGEKTVVSPKSLPRPKPAKNLIAITVALVVIVAAIVGGYFLLGRGGGEIQPKVSTFADSLTTAIASYDRTDYRASATALSQLSRSSAGTDEERVRVTQYLAASRLGAGDTVGVRELLVELHTRKPGADFSAGKFPSALLNLWNEISSPTIPAGAEGIEVVLQNYQPFAPVSVRVDGESRQYQGTALRFEGIRAGKHDVKIEGTGMKPVGEKVQVTGTLLQLTYTLEESRPSTPGSVLVTVKNYETFEPVWVSLDGKDKKYTGVPIAFGNVASGTYDIMVRADVCTLMAAVAVEGNQVEKTFMLGQEYSKLTVVASAADAPDLAARVYIDGDTTVENETPFPRQLVNGPHKVWIEHKHYVTVTKPQYIDLKKDMRIEFVLKKK
jgi:serine/threonine-protein kinase